MKMKLKIFKIASNLNFAILLLLLIALFSSLGTIIEQDQKIEFYIKNYSSYSIINQIPLWKLIQIFGIDHIYKTWWFYLLLLLFAFCIVSCTFTTQFPVLKLARRCNFKLNLNEIIKQEYYANLEKKELWKCLNNFKLKKYNIFQQKNFAYIYKGILGRFAPIIVHLAMLIILSGNVIAALGSLNSQELIVKGEIYQIQNIVSKNFLTKIPNYSIRVNDFWIEYGQIKNNIKQFYSDLSILDETGTETRQKTITVNYPLHYKDLNFYQTDWNALAIRINIENKNYQIPIYSINKGKSLFISWIPNFENNGLTIITNSLNGTFSVYNENGKFNGTYNIGDKVSKLKNLVISEIVTETGIQIRKDPGINLIYLGFAILMISSLISYFSFTQFWLLNKENTVFVGATTNRAKLNLKIEFLTIVVNK
jgi:cytochrome c biogenesis protein